MSTEKSAASKFANSEAYGGGVGNAAKRFLYNLATGVGKGSGKKGGGDDYRPRTAEDWHNQEIANRYEHGREDHRTRRDWKLGEESKINDYQFDQSGKNNDLVRSRGYAEINKDVDNNTARNQRTGVNNALRSGAKYGAKRVTQNDGGGFEVDAPGRYDKPLKAVTPPKSPVRKPATSRSTTGTTKPPTGRAGSARDSIVPSKSTVAKGKQFPAGSGGVTSIGGSAPTVY